MLSYEPPAHSKISTPYSQLVALGRQSPVATSKVYVVLPAMDSICPQEPDPTTCNAIMSKIADHLALRFRVAHVDLFGRDHPPGFRLPLPFLAKYLVEQCICGNLALAVGGLSLVAPAASEERTRPKPRWQCIRSRSPRHAQVGASGSSSTLNDPSARTPQSLPRACSSSEASETRGRPRRSAASEEREREACASQRIANYGMRLSSKCSRAVFYGSIDARQPLIATCPCCSSGIQVALEPACGGPPLAPSLSCTATAIVDDLGHLRGSRLILSSARVAKKIFFATVEEPACSSFCPICRRPLTITFGQTYKERQSEGL